MFDCLAASLNIALKWLFVFDQDHLHADKKFSSNILFYEQMFARLAIPYACCVQKG